MKPPQLYGNSEEAETELQSSGYVWDDRAKMWVKPGTDKRARAIFSAEHGKFWIWQN